MSGYVTVYLPPEVCGCLSLAQKHIELAGGRTRSRLGRDRRHKHLSKVQKLVAKAVKILDRREE